MRRAIFALVVCALAGGCFYHTGPRRTVVVEERGRSCPPAHHWDGRACVHNGNAYGHNK